MAATLTTLVSFNGTDGDEPSGGLIADASGDLFGLTEIGGANNSGTVFEIAKTAGGYASTSTILASFNGFDGELPGGRLLADANGDLFGTTAFGGPAGLGEGTVFEIVKTPTGYASMPGTVVNFVGLNGFDPEAGLIADASGDLFGTAEDGGANGDGTVFEISRTGDSSTLVSFNGADGGLPAGDLVVDASGNLFGTTSAGGANNGGTVFEIAKTPTGYAGTPTTLASFAEDSAVDGLITDANGDLFGTTSAGGSGGTVFEIKKTAAGYASAPITLASFDPLPLSVGGLIIDANGDLFGVTDGTLLNKGTVFEIKKTAGSYASTPTSLVSFNSLDHPVGGLIADAKGDLFGTTKSGGAHGDGTVFEITGSGFVPGPAKPPPPSIGVLIPKSRLTTLVSFNGADSSNPRGDLIADSNGDLFGTTADGGVGTPANPANGAVFEIKKTAGGYASTPTTLVSFNVDDPDPPQTPVAGLIADANGDLFGTSEAGGANDGGTVFEIKKTSAGYASTPTTLVSFGGADGAGLKGSLIADSDGDLFGTTSETVFEIKKTPTGYATTPTTLFNFNQPDVDLGNPVAGLVSDSNGDLFGTTDLGGQFDSGSVFEIKKTATGYASMPITIASFSGEDGEGEIPEAGLVADSRGDLFGTTSSGGAPISVGGDGFALGAGTVFEIKKTATGYASTPLTLATFHDLSDGLSPLGRLIMDANGDLFGTASGETSSSLLPGTPGTVFEIKKTAAGYASTPITLAAFNGADGATPVAGLIADASGDLFGTTSGGTPDVLTHDRGTVFEITDSGFATTATNPVAPASAPPNFFSSVAAAGILWQNSNGDTELWNPNGSGGYAGKDLGVVAGWQIAGTGDFNGAGEAGILWRNSGGATVLWNSNGSGGYVGENLGVIPTSWQVAGTGDFNGAGEDILWRNSSGDALLWNSNGSGGFTGQDLGVVPTSWQVAGTGDFTGTGEDSILWRSSGGDTLLWNPNGSGGFVGKDLGVVPTSWQVVETGDFNGSGRSGILWRSSGGDTELWNPNGSGGFTGKDLGVVPTSWSVHKIFA